MPNPLLTATNRILPALVTPLLPSGQLDEPSTERLINHLYNSGVGGLYVTGSTGEGIYLDFEIRQRLVEIAVSLSKGRGNVIVHVGAVQAAKTIDLAEHAARAGADAVSSIPPFAGGYSWAEVHAFYSELAQHSPLPVIAYYIPGLTGQQRTVEELASLLKIPNIAGYKFTEYNLYTMQRLLARFSPDQIMYNGPDEMLALGLQFGAHGGIGTTYNFMPELIVQIADLCREGRFDRGRRRPKAGQRHHRAAPRLARPRRLQANPLLARPHRPPALRPSPRPAHRRPANPTSAADSPPPPSPTRSSARSPQPLLLPFARHLVRLRHKPITHIANRQKVPADSPDRPQTPSAAAR